MITRKYMEAYPILKAESKPAEFSYEKFPIYQTLYLSPSFFGAGDCQSIQRKKAEGRKESTCTCSILFDGSRVDQIQLTSRWRIDGLVGVPSTGQPNPSQGKRRDEERCSNVCMAARLYMYGCMVYVCLPYRISLHLGSCPLRFASTTSPTPNSNLPPRCASFLRYPGARRAHPQWRRHC